MWIKCAVSSGTSPKASNNLSKSVASLFKGLISQKKIAIPLYDMSPFFYKLVEFGGLPNGLK